MSADSLVARGVRVTMLDSGGRRPRGVIVRVAGNTVFRYVSRAEVSEDRQASGTDPDTKWFSSLSLGGLSNYWTGAVRDSILRISPRGLASTSDTDGRSGTRISPSTTRCAERYLDVTGLGRAVPNLPMNDVKFVAALARAVDRTRRPLVCTRCVDGATPDGEGFAVDDRRASSDGVRRLHSLSSSRRIQHDGFELIRSAHVQDVTWVSSAGRVDGVRYLDRRTGELCSLAADAVVVAAGALDSTRILLSSTSADHPNGIGNSRGLLGRYVHDHPKEWWTFETTHPLPLPAHPVYIPREDPASSPALMAASHTIGLASPRDRLRTFYRGSGTRFGVQVFGTMRPTHDMKVSLSSTVVDEFGQPALDIDMSYDDDVRENLRRARRRLFDTFAEAGNPMRGPDSYPALEPGASVHYGGTARMHDSPEFGVLDRWNRVRDAPNVVVTDSSCFTTGAEKEPHPHGDGNRHSGR